MKRKFSTGMVLLALPLGVAACGGSNDSSTSGGSSSGGGSINLVSYSTPQTTYEESVIPAFQATDAGSGVEFHNSFGSSGDQSRAVEAGQPADVVHLPIEPDITRLVDAGLVDENYADTEPNGGVVQTSLVSFGVRPGNPKDIQSWDDLLRDDVDVVTPNPFTSGAARWNIMAAYGQAGGAQDDAAGLDFVKSLLGNTVVQDASARDSLNTFLGGQGDVIITYENDILGAQKAGEDVDLVIPDDTIRIDTIAVTTKDAPPEAQDFLDFLFSEDGQRAFADNGYRPVDPKVLKEYADQFPTPPGLFDISEFGGWSKVADEFFDPANGKIAAIEADLGVATE